MCVCLCLSHISVESVLLISKSQIAGFCSSFFLTDCVFVCVCVVDTRMTDTSCAHPAATHTHKENTHMYAEHANAHPRMPSCIKSCHTLSLSCRMCLATPPRASACSAQQATAHPICSSTMPPTTCRGFWVATPLGWAPLTPPCCKPSSVRVRVCVCVCVPVCTTVLKSGWLSGWRI